MLELDIRVCGRKKKCVGAGISGGRPPWAHEAGGHALHPHGQVDAPLVVFSEPKILKYSTKNHTKFAGHLEHFYFRYIFYCMDNTENRQIILFLLYLF